MALTFKQAFGPDAMLYRLHNTTDAPFYIKASKSLGDNPAFGRVSRDGYTAPQLYSGGDWYFNPKTNSFDYYPVAGGEPRKSISADEFGLDDPAYQIAGLATLEGKNGDSWSNYALTHNDYGGGVGSRDGVLNGAYQLRGAIGDINGYETKPSKSAWTALRDASQAASSVIGNYFLPGSSLVSSQLVSKGAQEHLNSPLGMVANVASGVTGGLSGNMANYGKVFDAATGATSGASTGAAGVAAEQAAAPVVDAAMTPVAAGAGETAAGGAGYFGGVGGASAGATLPGIGGAAGSSAIPEIGFGAAAGSSATPALFSTAELASAFPAAYNTFSDFGSGALDVLKAGKTAYTGVDAIDKMINKAVNDPLGAAATVGKTILNNPAEIGALYSALTGGSKSETLGGSGAGGGLSSAFMNQALPTINVPAYRSAAIQGDPLRYGLGGEQQLYTDQAGNAPSPLNFTGQNFGVPFNITQPAPYTPTPIPAQTPVQSGGLASIRPTAQPTPAQPAIQPAPAPAPVQAAAKPALTQQDVMDYLSSKGLDLTPEGVQRGLVVYNRENPNSQLLLSDVGAAFGFSPEQSRAWMYEGKTKAPSVFEALDWYKNQYAPTQTQSGGLASIRPTAQPTPAQPAIQPAPAPTQTQSGGLAALTQKDVTDYLSANNLQFDPQGINTALAKYNGTIGDPSKQYSINDVGAAFGYTPEQSRAWMQGQTQVTAPAPVQAAAKPALTQQDVTAYLAANNLNLDPSGISNALARYNAGIGDPSKQYSVADVGAAFGYTPEQSRAWMQGQKFAEGGAVGGYNCGGLSQAFGREEEDENERYVDGDGGGQDDDVPANLSAGEYVFDADLVSALGDGNNAAGAKILDEFREKVRKHKRSALPHKIPPKSKPVEQYMKGLK